MASWLEPPRPVCARRSPAPCWRPGGEKPPTDDCDTLSAGKGLDIQCRFPVIAMTGNGIVPADACRCWKGSHTPERHVAVPPSSGRIGSGSVKRFQRDKAEAPSQA